MGYSPHILRHCAFRRAEADSPGLTREQCEGLLSIPYTVLRASPELPTTIPGCDPEIHDCFFGFPF
jgi:hypothetical protein